MTTLEIFITQVRMHRIKVALEVALLSELGYEETDTVYRLGILGNAIETLDDLAFLTVEKFRMLAEGLISMFRGEIFDVENLSIFPVEYISPSCNCTGDMLMASTGGCCIEKFYFSNGKYIILLANGDTFSVNVGGSELYRIDGGKANPLLYHPSVQGQLPY